MLHLTLDYERQIHPELRCYFALALSWPQAGRRYFFP
jgi:hypothetical protein